jgi:hypothetical protein
MRKLLMAFIACVALMAWTSSAWAIIFSYSVDVGAGFGVPVDVFAAGNTSALRIAPNSGVLNVGATPIDLDVADLFLDTDNPIGGATDTISDVRLYTVRVYDTAVFGVGNFADWTQTVDLTISSIQEGSASGVLNAPIVVAPGWQMVGLSPVAITFKSFDFPGAPQALPGGGVIINPNTGFPYAYEGVGAKTDLVVSVPEPGVLALLVGVAVPASLFGLRRSRRAR